MSPYLIIYLISIPILFFLVKVNKPKGYSDMRLSILIGISLGWPILLLMFVFHCIFRLLFDMEEEKK